LPQPASTQHTASIRQCLLLSSSFNPSPFAARPSGLPLVWSHGYVHMQPAASVWRGSDTVSPREMGVGARSQSPSCPACLCVSILTLCDWSCWVSVGILLHRQWQARGRWRTPSRPPSRSIQHHQREGSHAESKRVGRETPRCRCIQRWTLSTTYHSGSRNGSRSESAAARTHRGGVLPRVAPVIAVVIGFGQVWPGGCECGFANAVQVCQFGEGLAPQYT
jgi:hypothetical protein